MAHTTKSIRDLLTHVESDELVLSEIQRDFVWSSRSVLKLFDSLFRGMPIGHILIWKARTLHYKFSGSAHTTIDRMSRKVAAKPSLKALWDARPKASLKPMRSWNFETSRLN